SPPRVPALCPYPTLFRSENQPASRERVERRGHLGEQRRRPVAVAENEEAQLDSSRDRRHGAHLRPRLERVAAADAEEVVRDPHRSEEHTSELQSRVDLVC